MLHRLLRYLGLYRPSSVRAEPCHHHFLWYSCHWQLFQLDSLRDAPPRGKAFTLSGRRVFLWLSS
nr:MAG TPA: hypothetical protein [Caudoviricetes sp.]